MPDQTPFDRLDQAVQQMLDRRMEPGRSGRADDDVEALLQIAEELRGVPRPEFRALLKAELERTVSMTSATETVVTARQTATPQLRIRNAAAAIDFYKKAFGAQELMRFFAGGTIAHAELLIGNSVVMLGEENPDWGFPGPEALGGSPVAMNLNVDNADAAVAQAIAAGARLVSPVADQFYGDRSGRVADPFGYSWTMTQRLETLSVDEMYRRFEALEAEQRATRTAPSFIPKGYRTVTPYIVVSDAPALIEFATRVFDAEETSRAVGSAGGVHAEIRIGDSMLMIGGGAPNLSWRGQTMPTALHVYVEDTDAAFERAVKAGATSIQPPADQEYGERSGTVTDAFGNRWYIATAKGDHYVREGVNTVNVSLHPLRGEPVIAFLKRAFGAEEVARYASPHGVIHHAEIKIGDSVIELGEAHGPYQPLPTMFYLYVPDVDATYHRATKAGATSMSGPADQPYGDRTASVRDVFGNQWYIATQIRGTR